MSQTKGTAESTDSHGATLLTIGIGVATDCGTGDVGNGGSTAATTGGTWIGVLCACANVGVDNGVECSSNDVVAATECAGLQLKTNKEFLIVFFFV